MQLSKHQLASCTQCTSPPFTSKFTDRSTHKSLFPPMAYGCLFHYKRKQITSLKHTYSFSVSPFVFLRHHIPSHPRKPSYAGLEQSTKSPAPWPSSASVAMALLSCGAMNSSGAVPVDRDRRDCDCVECRHRGGGGSRTSRKAVREAPGSGHAGTGLFRRWKKKRAIPTGA